MARIELRGVHASRDERTSLVDVHLDVPNGATLCVLGRSGSGKSTVLRVIAGLTEVSAGRVLLDGVDVTTTPTRSRRLGLVLRENTLPSQLTPRRTIDLPLSLRRGRGDHRREVEHEATVFGVEDLLDNQNSTLSGGQRVLVQSARALVDPPRAVLLDEPFADLDPHRRARLRRRLAERLDGTTVVLATSDPVEAMAVSDLVAVLDDGRMHQVGTPREIRDRPADVLVAELFGEPAMLLFPARVRRRGGMMMLEVEGAESPNWTPELAAYDGLSVTVGLWPEDVSVPPRRGDLVIRGVATQFEPLGPTTLTHLRTAGGVSVRVPVPGRARRLGDEIEVGLDPGRAHVFGPVDGQAIAHPPSRRASR